MARKGYKRGKMPAYHHPRKALDNIGNRVNTTAMKKEFTAKQLRTAVARGKASELTAAEKVKDQPILNAQRPIFKSHASNSSSESHHAQAEKQPLLVARNKESGATCLKLSTFTSTGTDRSEMLKSDDQVLNIDKQDIDNQFAVVDYVEDIYSFYRKAEMQSCLAPDYMSRQVDINERMRGLVINWLVNVHSSFDLKPEALFLAISLLDCFLSNVIVPMRSLQLVGGTAMLLAAKYEGMAPKIKGEAVKMMVCKADNVYNKEQILAMERAMLTTLNYNLTVPTPYMFILRLLKVASCDKQMERLVFFLVELSLHEYVMLKYPPSHLAAAAVYSAQHTLRRKLCWTSTLVQHSGYIESELKICSQMMVEFHRKANIGVPREVQRKYWAVATLTPAVIPDTNKAKTILNSRCSSTRRILPRDYCNFYTCGDSRHQ